MPQACRTLITPSITLSLKIRTKIPNITMIVLNNLPNKSKIFTKNNKTIYSAMNKNTDKIWRNLNPLCPTSNLFKKNMDITAKMILIFFTLLIILKNLNNGFNRPSLLNSDSGMIAEKITIYLEQRTRFKKSLSVSLLILIIYLGIKKKSRKKFLKRNRLNRS